MNTTDSRVELVLDGSADLDLTDAQRRRAIRALGEDVRVVAAEHRSQHRNRVPARERLVEPLRDGARAAGPAGARPSRAGPPSDAASTPRGGAVR